MKKRRLILFLMMLMSAIALQGCGVAREHRIRQEVLADASMPEEIRRAIDQKELVVGMTREQVIASWGLPCKWCFGTRKSPGGDTWEYNLFGSDLWVTGSDFIGSATAIYLYFDRHGLLKHWSNK